MKKSIIIPILCLFNYLNASDIQVIPNNKCVHLLAEGDKYLQRVPLCDLTAEKHSIIAMAYYKRFEICKDNLLENDSIYDFEIYQINNDKPYKCETKK